jgi:hypothetical protein
MQKLAHRWPHFSGALSILAAAVMVVLALPARPAAATLAACAIGAAAQNSITVEPSHGPVFYVDTGNSPVLDAGYVGYRVTNDTGSLQTDLWTEITGFTGGVMSLANPADDYFKLPSLADTETGTSYTLLKATGATTQAQKHTLRVYDHRPDLSNATLLYECEFTFSRVKETIKAYYAGGRSDDRHFHRGHHRQYRGRLRAGLRHPLAYAGLNLQLADERFAFGKRLRYFRWKR